MRETGNESLHLLNDNQLLELKKAIEIEQNKRKEICDQKLIDYIRKECGTRAITYCSHDSMLEFAQSSDLYDVVENGYISIYDIRKLFKTISDYSAEEMTEFIEAFR